MKRCLDLAQNAWPACRPNPMVGALLVHRDQIIAEGYTSPYGGPHAEVKAIGGAPEDALTESTLYVSLEPCAHHGKTPPCVDLILEKGIPRVVIGCRDPFKEVDGRGIEKLRAAGLEVTVGVLEEECRWQNRRFMTFHEKKRPYVILKWAESSDGYIDRQREGGKASQISSAASSQQVHQWRADEMAILIGGRTARMDDPSLTTRLVSGPSPERFVWTSTDLPSESTLHRSGYKAVQATSVTEVLKELYDQGMQSVLIEGGAEVHRQFLEEGLYDEVRRIIGSGSLGKGVEAPVIDGLPDTETASGSDRILTYLNTL
ncbi:MAG: bifunctional diaminohydroxyphosphoribosylaminopyrimidine deaminase/5-amino-6-(5-phosphoribosylamino)uracil reductase RibD [Flavobacteriales bacterium]|nr:bifunctional diaminohydroxyphosphoribosylaminopyrimidine deaminase/5-amino-6-(5-phosphoribosylamino)uracil reductase RibD [Flavobacteriales bacterium]